VTDKEDAVERLEQPAFFGSRWIPSMARWLAQAGLELLVAELIVSLGGLLYMTCRKKMKP
jgi:hypothetical protein